MPSVLIVDDEPDMRLLVRCLVEAAHWRVAGEAGTGEDAITRWRQLRPDVIVLDQRLPGLSGIETAVAILAEDRAQPIVLFTMVKDDMLSEKAKAIGVRVCLSKHQPGLLLPALTAQLAEGQRG